MSGITFAGYASSTHSVEIENSSRITLSHVSTSESVSVDGDRADVTLSRVEAAGGPPAVSRAGRGPSAMT